MTCRQTPFIKEPPGIKITKSVSDCCEDIPASALVYYNALYCHPASAMFSALPTGLVPPCAEIGDPNAPPLDPNPPGPPADEEPPISDPPPVTPPPDEPPPVLPPDEPPSDPEPPVESPPEIPPPPVIPPPIDLSAPNDVTSFKLALTSAVAGDKITPVPGSYAFGNFTLNGVVGTLANPIVIDGQNGLVTITSGPTEQIQFINDSYIQFINNVKFVGGLYGPIFDGCSYIVFEADVGSIQNTGISVKGASHHIWFQHIHVHDTGLGTPNNGQGILIGNLTDDIHHIYVWDFIIERVTAEGIDLDNAATHDCIISLPGKCFGGLTLYVPGVIESLIAINGDDHIVDGISVIKGAPYGITLNGGDGTAIRNCAADVQDIHSFVGTRYAYKVAGGATNYTIACSNKAQNGTFSNVVCIDEDAVPLPPIIPDGSLPTPLAPDAPLPFLRTRTANNVSELLNFIATALPGDLILLLGITYNVAASLNCTIAGTAAHPITIRGVGPTSVVNPGSSQTWHVKAPYWRFEKFRVTNAFYAFITGVDTSTGPGAPNCVWHQMEIDHCQQEGILLQHGSLNCYVQLSTFHDLGIADARYGEGVYVGGYGIPTTDCKILQNNFGPNCRAEAIDISAGSARTIAEGNNINCQTVPISGQTNSPLECYGIDCQITSNNIIGGAPMGIDVFAVAQGTILRNNRITLNSNGYGIRINGVQGNIKVYCDNVVNGIQSGGAAYSPNITCTPIISPPPVTSLRYPRGLWTQNYAYGEPLIDVSSSSASGFPAKLQQARTNGKRLALKLFAGYASQKTQAGDPELDTDPTAVIGGWSQRRAKQQVSNAHNLMSDVRSYVNDGTFICSILGDDITSSARALWANRVPTVAELEDLARHSKSVTGWATLPVTYRLPAEYLKQLKPSGYDYIDFAWNQIPFGGVQDIYGYVQKAYLDALSVNLGLMVGGNLLDGGAGPNSPDGWSIRGNRQNKYGMSPTEIGKLGDAILSLGDFRTLGCFFWTDLSYYPPNGTQAQLLEYFNRSDIQAALTNFSNKVKNVKLGPINYR